MCGRCFSQRSRFALLCFACTYMYTHLTVLYSLVPPCPGSLLKESQARAWWFLGASVRCSANACAFIFFIWINFQSNFYSGALVGRIVFCREVGLWGGSLREKGLQILPGRRPADDGKRSAVRWTLRYTRPLKKLHLSSSRVVIFDVPSSTLYYYFK